MTGQTGEANFDRALVLVRTPDGWTKDGTLVRAEWALPHAPGGMVLYPVGHGAGFHSRAANTYFGVPAWELDVTLLPDEEGDEARRLVTAWKRETERWGRFQGRWCDKSNR